jgi:hypothetical protein
MSQLSELFDELNEQFWNGRKPRYRVKFSSLARYQKLGDFQGECVPKRRTIYLRSNLKGKQLREVLLHEMLHIGCMSHGRKFQERLQYLADRGETWAKVQIGSYSSGPNWNQTIREFRSDLDTFAMHEPRPKWSQIVRYAKTQFGDTALKHVPWLRGAWRIAVRNADRINKIRKGYERRGLIPRRE